MTIQQAIDRLTALHARHGDVEIFYDCGHCGKSTRPDVIVAVVQLVKSPQEAEGESEKPTP